MFEDISGPDYDDILKEKLAPPKPRRKEKQYEFQELKDLDLHFPNHVAVLGPTQVGKNSLTRRLFMMIWPRFQEIFVFSSTAKFSDDYDFLENKNNIITLNVAKPEKALGIMLAKVKKIKAYRKEQISRGIKVPLNIAFILDDFLGSMDVSKGKYKQLFDSLASTSRHYGISLFFISQRATLNATIRENIAYWFLLNISANDLRQYVFPYQNKFNNYYDLERAFSTTRKMRYSSMFIQKYDVNKEQVIMLNPVEHPISFTACFSSRVRVPAPLEQSEEIDQSTSEDDHSAPESTDPDPDEILE